MLPPLIDEMWFILLYCLLLCCVFSLALYLPDNFRRKKEASTGGLLILVLYSVLSMLSGFATEELGAGFMMTSVFQLAGLIICTMAVSRVLQMLSWPRTWIAALLSVSFYLLVSLILSWCLVKLNCVSTPL